MCVVWCRCSRLCILSSGYSTTLICCLVCSPKIFGETQSLYCPCLADNDNGSRGLFRTRKCNPPLLEEFNLILPNTSWHRSEKPLVAVLCLSVKDCSRFTCSCHFMKGKSCDLCYHFSVDSIRKQENSSWCYSTQEMSFNPRISVNKQVLKVMYCTIFWGILCDESQQRSSEILRKAFWSKHVHTTETVLQLILISLSLLLHQYC